MKKNHIVKILSLLCVAMSFVFLTSCEDDDDKRSGQIELLSFGPSGVLHGEEIKFMGNNLDKVTAIIMPVGIEVPSSAFKTQTKGMITFDVPLETGYGKVMLRTPQGDIESKSIYSPEASIEIATVTDEAKPGTNITITGDFLDFVTSVWFSSNIEVTEFVNQSRSELVVTVPMEAKTGNITLQRTSVLPKSQTVVSEDPLIVTLPTITGISPLSLHHTDELTIEGSDLDLVTSISFAGDVSASFFESQSETSIVVKIPVGALNGTLTLHQTSPVSVTSADEITIILPKGTNLTPKPAIPGTDNITITGTDLDLVSELTLTGATAPIVIPADHFVSLSPTQIELTLPETASNGPISYKSIHGYSNNLGVSVLIPTEGPLPLDYYIYDDGLVNGWAKWNGWDTSAQDFASTEEVFDGTTSIKVTYSGQYGAIQIGSPSTGVFSGYTIFSFRIFAPAAQNFIIQLGEAADSYISVPAGWSEVNIPIADMAGNASVGELRFKNNNANVPVTLYIDYVGLKL